LASENCPPSNTPAQLAVPEYVPLIIEPLACAEPPTDTEQRSSLDTPPAGTTISNVKRWPESVADTLPRIAVPDDVAAVIGPNTFVPD